MEVLILLKCFLIVIFAIECIQSCSPGTFSEGDYLLCPNGGPNLTYTVKMFPHENAIKVICTGPAEREWNWSILPTNISFKKLHLVRLIQCPLTEGTFSRLFQRLGINTLHVRVENANSTQNLTLTKKHLEGLGSIRTLELASCNIQSIEEDVFDNTSITGLSLDGNKLETIPEAIKNLPNLTALRLTNNHIEKISRTLKHVPNLVLLSLDNNRITSIELDSFKYNTNLESIELSKNNLTDLPVGVFDHLSNLYEISLNNNDLKVLRYGLFSSNKNLRRITIIGIGRGEVEDRLFENLTNLEEVKLSKELEEIKENVFRNCTNLKTLNLVRNNLRHLPGNLFKDLKNLTNLHLDSNQIETINSTTFSNLGKLENLWLGYNQIRKIDVDAFKNNKNLRNLDLKKNQLTFLDSSPNFQHCSRLETLDLSGNYIDRFEDSWYIKNLRNLLLRDNEIQEFKVTSAINQSSYELIIELGNNMIRTVDLTELEIFASTLGHSLDARSNNRQNIVVHMDDNPISCDCTNFGLLRYFKGDMDETVKSLVSFDVQDFVCMEPKPFHKIELTELQLIQLVCPVNNTEICPDPCDCFKRPYDTSFIVDCSSRGLKVPPVLNELFESDFFNQTIVDLQDNFLTFSPLEEMGYGNVSQLYLSKNWIRDVAWVPPRLEVLDLEGNRLSGIGDNVVEALNSSKTLREARLGGNRWDCECKTLALSSLLVHRPILDKGVIHCFNSSKLVINLLREEVCRDDTTLFLVLSIIVTIFLLIIAILFTLYYKYQEEIKVWLFARKLFLFWIREEDLDKHKEYDAFISYSHLDSEFVENILVPVLESGPKPYKLLLHYRSFMPGDEISKQIAEAVANSKRTVVVLSPNFVTSVWGRMEFETAHITAMKENRPRLIVIMLDDVPEKDMFDNVKMYLSKKSSIKWDGSNTFWNTLKYNLPHEKCFDNISENKVNKIMCDIEKIDLFTVPSTPNCLNSTPPLTLDPLMSKRHPLEFRKSDLNVTPPAEGGALVVSV